MKHLNLNLNLNLNHLAIKPAHDGDMKHVFALVRFSLIHSCAQFGVSVAQSLLGFRV